MTAEELKAKCEENKRQAWMQMSHLSDASRSLLDASGYTGKTNAETVLLILQTTRQKNEKLIQAWEKANL